MHSLISVIVPVYNVERYLKRCIDSILKQTYKNLEIILVDDGSTDRSGEICDEYKLKDERIVVLHKKNGGPSSARNTGLDVAKGQFIGFVDSDDYIAENMYELLIQRLGNSMCDVANIMYVRAHESGENVPSRVPHNTNEDLSVETYFGEELLHLGDMSVCTKLFPQELIHDLRFTENVLNEDLLFIMDLMKRVGKIRFVGSVGYYYFVRAKSVSSAYGKSFIDMQKNSLTVLDFANKHFPRLRKQAYRFALYQNMVYLLYVPRENAKKENASYHSALKFVRRYTLRNLFNQHLRIKYKLILCLLMVAPKTMASKFKSKNKRRG